MTYDEAVELFNAGNFDGCIAGLSEAINSFPPNESDYVRVLFHRLRGDAYSEMKRFREAAEDYLECVLRRNDAADYSRLAFAYQDAGEHDKALKEIGFALRIRPHDPDVLVDAGQIHFALGQSKKAIRFYKKATGIGALSPFWELGVFLPKVQWHRNRQKNVMAFYYMGIAYRKMGKDRLARRAFQYALSGADSSTEKDLIATIQAQLR